MGCGASSNKKDEGKPLPPEETVPKDFPIHAERRLYICWDESCAANHVLMCSPKSADEVVQVCNWAADNKWKVRATGIKHNWSPITVQNVGVEKNLNGYVLVSLMEHMTKVSVKPADGEMPPLATVELGCKQKDFLTALEKAPGGTEGIGYGMVHTPAPDDITIGGILAIDGHGTSIPVKSEEPYLDPKWANYGSYSNCMVACKAIVWDAKDGKYACKEFRREDGDAIAPFLSHVGKALLVEATLQVVPNYYMRCVSRLDIDWETMFPPTPADPMQPQKDSMMEFILKSGRAEAIWFPFTDCPWFKHWEVTGPELPEGSTKVDGMTNYTFADDLGPNLTKFYRSLVGSDNDRHDELVRQIRKDEAERFSGNEGKAEKKNLGTKLAEWFDEVATDVADDAIEIVGGPRATPFVNKCTRLRVCAGLLDTDTDDIWGPSKNTLIYVKSTTLKVTANGYVVMTTLDNVQECMHVFAKMYHELLQKYKEAGKYPIACPLEIRVTGVDKPDPIFGTTRTTYTPPTSALTYDETAEARKWDVALWLDVLSFPGAPNSNDFYVEMEKQLMSHPTFIGEKARIRPEWSKGWGYDAAGPWTSESFRDHTRRGLPRWDEMMAQYAKHDPKELFTNAWMDKFFVKVNGEKATAAA